MRLAAVCAIYGGYDLIPPVPEGVDDAVLVTDVPVRSDWRNVVEPSDVHPRLAAKRPKARPDLYTHCEGSLWIDGSAYVLSDQFVPLVREKLVEHELILWEHPEDRNCLVEEAAVCQDWPQYRSEPLRGQVSHYLSLGMPRNFGLWAAGSIARRHSVQMARFGDAWLEEMERWTIQDQVSLPFVLWNQGIDPGTFGLPQFDNDLITWLPHRHEFSTYRTMVPRLNARIAGLEDERLALIEALESEKAQHCRLRSRRAVRMAVSIADALGRALRALDRGRARS